MDRLEVSTVVYVPAERVYEFLLDFPGYAAYSEHLRSVTARGEGGPGTTYDLTFGWWKLTHTVRSAVTAVDPPSRIEWELRDTLEARGYWQVEPLQTGGDRPVTRVSFVVRYAPESTDTDGLDLPSFVSLEWLVERVRPKIHSAATTTVERVVEDLEGEPREVTLEIDVE